jgi:hypothetical protein
MKAAEYIARKREAKRDRRLCNLRRPYTRKKNKRRRRYRAKIAVHTGHFVYHAASLHVSFG